MDVMRLKDGRLWKSYEVRSTVDGWPAVYEVTTVPQERTMSITFWEVRQ